MELIIVRCWNLICKGNEIMEQDMIIYTITRIDEADFGCEGRPEGYIPMVTVYLEDEYGGAEVIEMEDAQMYHRALDEGSQVVIGGDGTLYSLEAARRQADIIPVEETADTDQQNQWLEGYMDAVEELEEESRFETLAGNTNP
ncbi:putative uncharacterized protein [Clostridium sp. CAG:277]|nr:putative uncharacterized protein [Clostridium sp. CAG:277]